MAARTILTYEGLEAAPNDGLRRELLGGDLYVSPAPSPAHQSVVTKLILVLGAYAERSGGRVFPAPIDVVFSSIDAVQPDVVYVGPEQLSIIGNKNIQGAPALPVEVLSPSSSDIDPERKLETYARFRVPEYWIADPRTRTIVAHAQPSGKRYLRVVSAGAEPIRSLTLPDLIFALPSI